MIPRYSLPAMASVWTDANRLRLFLEIEVHAMEGMVDLGLVSAEDFAEVRAKATPPSPEAVAERERETKHEILAFLAEVENAVGPAARSLHRGLTSSDVLDTALAVQLRDAGDLLLEALDATLAALAKRAREHKRTPCIGRSHGIHAEPTTFGIKLAGHYAEFARARARLVRARDEVATCALSGAVGVFAHLAPEVEAHVAKRMGLTPEPVSTQIIPRDRHAAFFAAMALAAAAMDRLAIEIRHLQRTEVGEAEEPFSVKQKGSSAMPHKRNPVLSENLSGLARLVRSALAPALENIALWHERDISHSSVERVIAPDATIALHFGLHRLAGMIDGLVVHAEVMRTNLERLGGIVYSQAALLALTDAGMRRQDAYAMVQRAAMAARDNPQSFLPRLCADPDMPLDPKTLTERMSLDAALCRIDVVFARALGSGH